MADSPLSLGQIRDLLVDQARAAGVRLGGISLIRGEEVLEEKHPSTTVPDRLLALGIAPAAGLTLPGCPSWASLLAVPPPSPKALELGVQGFAG